MRAIVHLYGTLSWGIVLLGTVHMLTTAALTGGSAAGRVWFFGAGIAMVLAGALNLLNRAYGARAVGVRRVCIGSNVLMTCFAVAAGVFTNAGPAQFIVVLGLVGITTVLSFLRTPFTVRGSPTTDVPIETSGR
jgi:hypothetical protein